MKKLLLSLLLLSSSLYAQDYEICNWYNGKKAAAVMTFDDGSPDHEFIVVPTLNSYGLVGSFYVNGSGATAWYKTAIAQGHEIGNHTKSHPHLLTLPNDSLWKEINVFNDTLSVRTGAPVTTLAYPYGEGGENVPSSYYVQDTVAKKHIGARWVLVPAHDSDFVYNFAQNEREYYQVKTIDMHPGTVNFESSTLNALNGGGLITYTYHGVGAPGVFHNVEVSDFKKHLDFLKKHEDSLWVATFEAAIKYHREKKAAKLTEVSAPFANGNTWVVSLTDTLNDAIFNHALTLKLKVPAPITVVRKITQNGNELSFTAKNDTVIFNAIPDGGNIELEVLDCVQPNDTINIKGALTFCLPDSVILTAEHNVNYSYKWYKNGALLTQDTNKIVIKESGTYYVGLELNGCPNESNPIKVTVTGNCGEPVANFTASDTIVYTDSVMTYTSTSTNVQGGETYYWDFGADASKAPGFYGPGPIDVTYSSAGKKTVKLVVQGSLKKDSLTKTDYVEIKDYIPCFAFKNDFNANTSDQLVDGWHNYTTERKNGALRINMPKTASAPNQWYVFTFQRDENGQPGPFDFSDPSLNPVLKLRMKASDTCAITLTLSDANNKQTAGMSLSSINTFELTEEYQDIEVNFSNLFYNQWENNLKLDSTKIYNVVLGINPGYVDWPLSSKYGGVYNQPHYGFVDIDWISVGSDCEPEPQYANIVLPDTICVNQNFSIKNASITGLNNTTYDWKFGNDASLNDTIVMDDKTFNLSYSTTGTKTVELEINSTESGTIKVQESVVVVDCLGNGIEEQNAFTKLQFINPIRDVLQGSFSSEVSGPANLRLMDAQGRLIFHQVIQLQKGNNSLNYNLTDIAAGTYIVTLQANNSYAKAMLVK